MDDVTTIKVDSVLNNIASVTIPNTTTTFGDTITWPSSNYYWSYSPTIYMYQVKCPKRSCKKMNWLQLDKITPCTGCGAKLKAVSEQAEFEIEIN